MIFHMYSDVSKPLSHSTAIPRRLHGDLKFLRAPWDCTTILEKIANNFTFSITWRCHGVLTGDWLRGHGALMACSGRAKSCHCASTACTQRARCAQCVSTASARSVYTSISETKRSRHDIAELVMHMNGSWVIKMPNFRWCW